MGTKRATIATGNDIRHPAAWWATGRLDLHWAGRKRIATGIDSRTTSTDVVRVWQVVSGEVLVEHGGRSWRAAAGTWLILPGAVARQRIATGVVLRSLGCTWLDADRRLPLAGLPPCVVAAAHHRDLDRAVTRIERWTARHGAGWPDAASPRSANLAPLSAPAYGTLQEGLFALLGVLLGILGQPRSTGGDAAVERALACLGAHAEAPFPGSRLLATAAGLGPRRLEQRFAAALATTPRAWHNRLRVAAACRRLSGPPVAVKALARDLGFGGAPAFRRWFHAATGCSPLAWRRRSLQP